MKKYTHDKKIVTTILFCFLDNIYPKLLLPYKHDNPKLSPIVVFFLVGLLIL